MIEIDRSLIFERLEEEKILKNFLILSIKVRNFYIHKGSSGFGCFWINNGKRNYRKLHSLFEVIQLIEGKYEHLNNISLLEILRIRNLL